MKSDKPRFWMVLGLGTPTYRHETKASAAQEAERLARMNPGERFTVLEAIATVVHSNVHWESLEKFGDDLDEIPF